MSIILLFKSLILIFKNNFSKNSKVTVEFFPHFIYNKSGDSQ